MSVVARLKQVYGDMDEAARLRVGVAIAAILVLALLYSAANDQVSRLTRKKQVREAALAEMLVLRQRYREANVGAQKLANRLSATRPDDTPAKLIDEIGIKGKGSQIRPVKGDERPGMVEDAADVKLEGLTANETVNLLYRLEKGAKPVIIKKGLIRTRFDDPAKLDLSLTLSLLKPAPAGQR